MINVVFYAGHAVLIDFVNAIKSRRDVTIVSVNRLNKPELDGLVDKNIQITRKESLELSFWSNLTRDLGGRMHLHVSADNEWFFKHRKTLADNGISLTCGVSLSAKDGTLEVLEDKLAFTQVIQQAGFSFIPSERVENLDELKKVVSSILASGKTPCLKPVKGIYGAEFWRLDPTASHYACFADPDARIVNPELYYKAVQWRGPMLVMPFLSGAEYSVDALCVNGEVLVAAARKKVSSSVQIILAPDDVMHFAKALAKQFLLDGVVNIQFMRDDEGGLYPLEINARPSGGAGQLITCGIDLMGWWVDLLLGVSHNAIKSRAAPYLDVLPKTIKKHSRAILIKGLI